MNRNGWAIGAAGFMILVSTSLQAGMKTYISQVSNENGSARSSSPALHVRVTAYGEEEADRLRAALVGALGAHTLSRVLAANEPSEYVLWLNLYRAERIDASVTKLEFEAGLASPDERALWRISGRTELEAVPIDDAVFRSIAQNIVDRLIMDGWAQVQDDPQNPPPPPPRIRTSAN